MSIDSKVIDALQSRLDYSFSQPACLIQALTHPSCIAAHPKSNHNQRLEFLGDAVLQLSISEQLYERYPDVQEGALSKMRAGIVSEEGLCARAQAIGLGEYLLLGRGEENSGGREKPSILADAMEAVLGAVFIDGGWEAARGVVLHLFGEVLCHASARSNAVDYKTRLQELCQQKKSGVCYALISRSGPDHAPNYHFRVLVGDAPMGEGWGHSKKEAEQRAAQAALEAMQGEESARF